MIAVTSTPLTTELTTGNPHRLMRGRCLGTAKQAQRSMPRSCCGGEDTVRLVNGGVYPDLHTEPPFFGR